MFDHSLESRRVFWIELRLVTWYRMLWNCVSGKLPAVIRGDRQSRGSGVHGRGERGRERRSESGLTTCPWSCSIYSTTQSNPTARPERHWEAKVMLSRRRHLSRKRGWRFSELPYSEVHAELMVTILACHATSKRGREPSLLSRTTAVSNNTIYSISLPIEEPRSAHILHCPSKITPPKGVRRHDPAVRASAFCKQRHRSNSKRLQVNWSSEKAPRSEARVNRKHWLLPRIGRTGRVSHGERGRGVGRLGRIPRGA